jgi:hypothetical protein
MTALTLRLDDVTYERLRCEAFERRTTISVLVREALAPVPLTADQIAERCSGYPLSGLAIAGILAAAGLAVYDESGVAQ